jgi:probable rRNA maturation factor
MVPKISLLFPPKTDPGLRAEMKSFAEQLRLDVTSGQPFVCLFAGDEKLAALNREFLGKDYPTDVLSFPNPEPEGSEEGLGEIAISLPRAAVQAAEFGHSLAEECKILLLHGVLHLMGLDHEGDRGQMRRVESKLRQELGLNQGLIERAKR